MRNVQVELTGEGTLTGEVQRVGRAELEAAIQLLNSTAGPMILHTDYKALVCGHARGPTHTKASRMADLWERFWEALDARPGGREQVAIKKVKAHVSEEAARSGEGPISMRYWHGNRIADEKARAGAARNQLPTDVVERVQLHTKMAELFMRRMTIILDAVLQVDEASDRPPALHPAHHGDGDGYSCPAPFCTQDTA